MLRASNSMVTKAVLQIESIGRPPERHADRVVAEMMRQLARDRSRLWDTISEVVANSSDGSPRAQRKMEKRIKRAGALTTDLWPGKRGRYTLMVYDLCGWDAQRDAAIQLGDRIPERPWISCNLTCHREQGRRSQQGTTEIAAGDVRHPPRRESSGAAPRGAHE